MIHRDNTPVQQGDLIVDRHGGLGVGRVLHAQWNFCADPKTGVALIVRFGDIIADRCGEEFQLLARRGHRPPRTNTKEPGMAERHLRIEYDPGYSGGDYSGTGWFAYLPFAELDKHDGDVPKAFQAHFGVDPAHIVHYSRDEAYTSEGELIEDEAAPGPRPD